MRLLVMGGSFNPIHVGHLILAEEVRAAFGYDVVVMVPAFNPPHKTVAHDPGPEARVAMVRAAVIGDDSLIVDDCEIRRGGVSYTIDTVREIARRFGIDGKPGLILGDDLLADFSSWKEPDVLAREVDLVCAHREHRDRIPFRWPHRYADNLVIPISSSLVRHRVAAGLPYRRLVPEGVWRIITEKGYYRE